MSTKKGPGKLRKACLDEGLDVDLSAHACVNMIKMGRDPEVKTEVEPLPPPRREQLATKMAGKLWDVARIEGEMQMPAPLQISAKDGLVLIPKHADAQTKTLIDGYLIDWYAVPSFEGRAKAGAARQEV